jgi:hypothetical protein
MPKNCHRVGPRRACLARRLLLDCPSHRKSDHLPAGCRTYIPDPSASYCIQGKDVVVAGRDVHHAVDDKRIGFLNVLGASSRTRAAAPFSARELDPTVLRAMGSRLVSSGGAGVDSLAKGALQYGRSPALPFGDDSGIAENPVGPSHLDVRSCWKLLQLSLSRRDVHRMCGARHDGHPGSER